MLTGLDEGQGLHGFVQSTEPSGEEDHGLGLLEKSDLPVKEIFIQNRSRVALKHRIGLLLKGEPDVHTETVFRTGSLVNGLHDARAAAGDHHVSGFHQLTAQLFRHLVQGGMPGRPCRSEDGDFGPVAIGAEDFGGVTHLFQGGVHQYEVELPFIFLAGFEGSDDQFPDNGGSLNSSGRSEQVFNQFVGRTVGRMKTELRGRIFLNLVIILDHCASLKFS